MARFIPLKADTTANTVANVFCREVVSKFGIPRSIVSDRDKRFLSKFWAALWEAVSTELDMSLAYHPEMDCQTERTHRTIEQVLRCTLAKRALRDDQWDTGLMWAESAYNAFPHSSTGMTPFEIVYGRKPTFPLTRSVDSIQVPAARAQVVDREKMWTAVKTAMGSAQRA